MLPAAADAEKCRAAHPGRADAAWLDVEHFAQGGQEGFRSLPAGVADQPRTRPPTWFVREHDRGNTLCRGLSCCWSAWTRDAPASGDVRRPQSSTENSPHGGAAAGTTQSAAPTPSGCHEIVGSALRALLHRWRDHGRDRPVETARRAPKLFTVADPVLLVGARALCVSMTSLSYSSTEAQPTRPVWRLWRCACRRGSGPGRELRGHQLRQIVPPLGVGTASACSSMPSGRSISGR